MLFTVPHLQLFPAKKDSISPLIFQLPNHPNAFSVSIYLCDRRIWNDSEKSKKNRKGGSKTEREEGERCVLNSQGSLL